MNDIESARSAESRHARRAMLGVLLAAVASFLCFILLPRTADTARETVILVTRIVSLVSAFFLLWGGGGLLVWHAGKPEGKGEEES